MKRSLIRTALSVCLSLQILGVMSCTVATNTNNAVSVNGNTNAPPATTNANANTSPGGNNAAITAEVTAKEKALWDALKRRDYDAFEKMLSSDNVYVSSDVVGGKAATVDGVRNFAPTEVNLSDWKTVVLDQDAVVVTYTVDAKGTAGGQPIPPGAMRASTAWVKRGAEWLAVYHQDTPIEETPPPTPAAETAKPAASAAANSNTNTAGAAKPAGTGAATDPLAKEKETWDALKRKDWETFSANLAEDQVEVEPSGVYDKAGTLAAVKQFDFSKASVSDFKATKWDDDATLVTYTVRAPGPDGKMRDERASTIWANRGGKWLAVFHMGTPVIKMPAK
jgi:hypothetical protein